VEVRFEILDASADVERIDVFVGGRLIGAARPPAFRLDWNAPAGSAGARIAAGVYIGGHLVERLEVLASQTVVDDVLDVVAVELYPVVTDRRGAYVRDLTRDDFLVYDDGQPVAISTFSVEPQSLTVAFLIDRSESMRSKLPLVQEAAIDFLARLEPDDRALVLAFNHALAEISSTASDPETAKSSVRALTAVGGTALFDAVVGALDALGRTRGRKVMVLFSDGRDERSLTSLDRAAEHARRGEVILYTVGSGEEGAHEGAREDLRRLAEESGGRSYRLGRLRDLGGVFAEILADVRAQYALTFSPAHSETGEHRITVQVRGDGMTQVRHRKSYLLP
jgi:Ca-activated chloride channel homolog